MPQRFSLKFAVTTQTSDGDLASPHSGSWSEGFWDQQGKAPDGVEINELARNRAGFLPIQCQIIGWKIQQYTIAGNRLLPGGSTTVKHRYGGNSQFSVDAPQVGLSFSAAIVGRPNGVRFSARGFPDECVVNGELVNVKGIIRKLGSYTGDLVFRSFGSPVRDLTQPSYKVLSITNGVIDLGAPALVAVGDYLRLNRVESNLGFAISGAYRITGVSGNLYTSSQLVGFSTNGESGSARKDLVVFGAYSEINVDRVCVRKIGGPFEKYRGRRSKRR